MTVRRPTSPSSDDPLVPALDVAGQPAAVLDDPERYMVDLPQHLTLSWVLHLTLPPGPRPILLWGERGGTAGPGAVEALAWRLFGRRVALLRVGPLPSTCSKRLAAVNLARGVETQERAGLQALAGGR
ncbi:MAG: hypothetical protein M3P96_05345 [Actinomycetota bacterium]|nr:hypothetical protein [Actinomycetota bacterium]